MNLPNRLTCFRIVLTVVFMFLLFAQGVIPKALALGTFLLASFTDYWDGKIARERGQITAFGKLMDPVADKILTLSAFLAFVQMDILPAWMVVLIIARDLLITGIRLVLPVKGEAQAARSSGKHKTALQLASILGVLIFLTAKETVWWQPEWTAGAHLFIYYGMFLIVAVTLSSGVWYLMQNRELLHEPVR